MYESPIDFDNLNFEEHLKNVIAVLTNEGDVYSFVNEWESEGLLDECQVKAFQNNLYSWIRGDTTPNMDSLSNLCKFTKVSADYYLFGNKNNLCEEVRIEIQNIEESGREKYIELKKNKSDALKEVERSSFEERKRLKKTILNFIDDDSAMRFVFMFPESMKSHQKEELRTFYEEVKVLRKEIERNRDQVILSDNSKERKKEEMFYRNSIIGLTDFLSEKDNENYNDKNVAEKLDMIPATFSKKKRGTRKVNEEERKKIVELTGLPKSYVANSLSDDFSNDDIIKAMTYKFAERYKLENEKIVKKAKKISSDLIDALDDAQVNRLFEIIERYAEVEYEEN